MIKEFSPLVGEGKKSGVPSLDILLFFSAVFMVEELTFATASLEAIVLNIADRGLDLSTLFLKRFEITTEARHRDVLLVYSSVNSLNEADFVRLVNAEIEENLAPDEIMVVVRLPVYEITAAAFSNSPDLVRVRERLRNKSAIILCAFDADGRETRRSYVEGDAQFALLRVEDIVRRTITDIFSRHKGYVIARGNYHFQIPSLRHTTRFIRFASILVEASEISFVALGALPYLNGKIETAYVDTSQLFAFVSAVGDHMRAFYPDSPPIIVENFKSYEGYESFPFDPSPNNFVFISASTSGGLADEVLRKTKFKDSNRVIHLLYHGEDPNPPYGVVICNLAKDAARNPGGYDTLPENYRIGQCPLCDAGSTFVPLQGDYFELAGPQPRPLKINSGDAPPQLKEFMKQMVGQNVLFAGFGTPRQAIPRQFHVSPERLLCVPQFLEKLDYELEYMVPVGTGCIVCLSEESRPFAERVREHIRKTRTEPPPIISPEELSSLPNASSNDPVIIAAAVVESGRSLMDISRDLRRPFPKAPQLFLIGFVKFQSDAKFSSLKSTLVKSVSVLSHGFVGIESLQLPPSSEQNAWDKERSFLQGFRFPSESLETFRTKRLDCLENVHTPLLNELFVSNSDKPPMKLQPGFAFWPPHLSEVEHSQADVFFTIASILQNLRANEENKARALRYDLFQQTVLDPSNFGRFNDGIVQASLLRAARPNELDYSSYPEGSDEMARLLRRIILSSDRPRGEAAIEFLVALGTERLRLHPRGYKEVLAPTKRENLPIRVEALRKVLCPKFEVDDRVRK